MSLPNWVYDLVADIQKYENEHPSAASRIDDLVGQEWAEASKAICAAKWLGMVPEEVRNAASLITEYIENEKELKE